MKELLLNVQLDELAEIKDNIFLGKVKFNDKILSTHIIDLNHLNDNTYLPFNPEEEANYSNEIMSDIYYKLENYEKWNLYYHIVTNNPNTVKWKEGFLYDRHYCRKFIITPLELDNLSKKKQYKNSGDVLLISGDTGSGKTQYIKKNYGSKNTFNPMQELTSDDLMYKEFISYFNYFNENHYQLLSSGEKIIHNSVCYLINQIKSKKNIIFDNSLNQLDDLNFLSLIDLIREITLIYHNNIVISSSSNSRSNLVNKKFFMLEKFKEKDLSEVK